MGYTHYWRAEGGLKDGKFAEFAKDVARLLKSAPVAVEFGDDTPPQADAMLVQFNGVGAGAHETFVMSPFLGAFNFCKTARKPYDLLVTASLIAAKRHFGDDIKVSSDGGDEGWEEGRDLCARVLGYGEKFHIASNTDGDMELLEVP